MISRSSSLMSRANVGRGASSLRQLLYLAIGIQERHVDRPPWLPSDVEFDDADLRVVGPQEPAKALQDDVVVVDERDTNAFGHARMVPSPERKTPDRVIENPAMFPLSSSHSRQAGGGAACGQGDWRCAGQAIGNASPATPNRL
jgi:hypothetical protein